MNDRFVEMTADLEEEDQNMLKQISKDLADADLDVDLAISIIANLCKKLKKLRSIEIEEIESAESLKDSFKEDVWQIKETGK